jgi:hypothetical protein
MYVLQCTKKESQTIQTAQYYLAVLQIIIILFSRDFIAKQGRLEWRPLEKWQ